MSAAYNALLVKLVKGSGGKIDLEEAISSATELFQNKSFVQFCEEDLSSAIQTTFECIMEKKAKAATELKAKLEAEEAAKAIAELKAKLEAEVAAVTELKAKLEAEVKVKVSPVIVASRKPLTMAERLRGKHGLQLNIAPGPKAAPAPAVSTIDVIEVMDRKKNNHKTFMCDSVTAGKACAYGAKCLFAHTPRELFRGRVLAFDGYKTKMCNYGSCCENIEGGPENCRYAHSQKELDLAKSIRSEVADAEVAEVAKSALKLTKAAKKPREVSDFPETEAFHNVGAVC
jgi:hypothetical protein